MNHTPLLAGPRLEPFSKGRATGLLILLHGFGSDGRALITMAQALRPFLPDTAFVAPQGQPLARGYGYHWFQITRADADDVWRGARQAGPLLDRFIDEERDRLGIPDEKIVLAGFSQGAIMALHVGLRRKKPLGAVLGYAGFLAGAEHLDEIVSRPPVTLVHGERDYVVPLKAHQLTVEALKKANVPVTSYIAPNTGHSVEPEGLALGLGALQRVFLF